MNDLKAFLFSAVAGSTKMRIADRILDVVYSNIALKVDFIHGMT